MGRTVTSPRTELWAGIRRTIGTAQTGKAAGAQNSILYSQIFILEEQLLIDHARHVGEQAHPFVLFHREFSVSMRDGRGSALLS